MNQEVHDGLYNYSGRYLQIAGDPKPVNATTVDLTLRGHQPDATLSSFIRNATGETVLSIRRLLLIHGIALDEQQTEIQVSGNVVEANVRLVAVTQDDHSLLEGLEEGMYIARPSHFNGTEPTNADRLNFDMMGGHVLADAQQLDVITRAVEPLDNQFAVAAQPGELEYYPWQEDADHLDFLTRRLRYGGDKTDAHSAPYWKPHSDQLQDPGVLAAMRVHGLQAQFHSLVANVATQAGTQNIVVNSPMQDFYIGQQNTAASPREMNQVSVQFFDRRKPGLRLPVPEQDRASAILTDSYDAASDFLDRVEHYAWQQPEKRPAALTVNQQGIDQINNEFDTTWVCTTDNLSVSEQSRMDAGQLHSTLMHEPSRIVSQGRMSPIIRLLERAATHGMDGRGVIASTTFPQHAALDAMIANEVNGPGQRRVDTLLFRNPSPHNGPFFSLNDYNALRSFVQHGIDVYWANPDMTESAKAENSGVLLKLVELKKQHKADEDSSCLMFVPPERIEEFLNGTHFAFYGTARTLEQPYIDFMEELFEGMEQVKDGNQLVVHSGGGPDASTMGEANRLARVKKFLSVGHPLGVKKEPMGSQLDCQFPFRNTVRDARQGNMSAAADIVFCMEGGGGTREERGITLTDIAIARETPMPIVLVGVDFYLHEYLQYCKEVAAGTLDDYVIDCVSLVDTSESQKGVEIVGAYINEGKTVKRILPTSLSSSHQKVVNDFAVELGMEVGDDDVTLDQLCDFAKAQFEDSKAARQSTWHT